MSGLVESSRDRRALTFAAGKQGFGSTESKSILGGEINEYSWRETST